MGSKGTKALTNVVKATPSGAILISPQRRGLGPSLSSALLTASASQFPPVQVLCSVPAEPSQPPTQQCSAPDPAGGSEAISQSVATFSMFHTSP